MKHFLAFVFVTVRILVGAWAVGIHPEIRWAEIALRDDRNSGAWRHRASCLQIHCRQVRRFRRARQVQQSGVERPDQELGSNHAGRRWVRSWIPPRPARQMHSELSAHLPALKYRERGDFRLLCSSRHKFVFSGDRLWMQSRPMQGGPLKKRSKYVGGQIGRHRDANFGVKWGHCS